MKLQKAKGSRVHFTVLVYYVSNQNYKKILLLFRASSSISICNSKAIELVDY